MLDVAEMFDVNVFAGMSFLLYPLESSDVKTVAADWEKIFPSGQITNIAIANVGSNANEGALAR